MSENTIKHPVSLLSGDKPLPHNIEAEIAVLGSMILSASDAIDTAVGILGFSGSFYSQKHQIIFEALKDMWNAPEDGTKASIDPVTLSAYLEKKGQLVEAGNSQYLMKLLNSVPTSANVEHYSNIVYENAVLRKLIKTGSEIVDDSFKKTASIRGLLDEIERKILDIGKLKTHKSYKPIKDLVQDAFEYIEDVFRGKEDAVGISTGYEKLDETISGLKPTEMFVLAARPSVGKTALALNIASNVATSSNPKKVAIFSLEMSSRQVVTRLLCSMARMSLGKIKSSAISNSHWDDLGHACDILRKAPIFIDDTVQLDIFELRTKARRIYKEHGLDLIIIDYLQLMRAPASTNSNSSREQEVAQISGGIKGLAKELNIPIMVLAQLNRMSAQTGSKPKLSHLRESGAIEQDADVVALLHRDRDSAIEASPEAIEAGMPAEVIIAKNRNGETNLVKLRFFQKYTRFETETMVAEEDVP
ncbi:MAG: replicative DNA helicase [Verrucomicrobiota bacterium]|nr:replicative DNA helicase [Verrucomicrobiota bacterium]